MTATLVHGRATSYKRQGCRCDACYAAKRAEDAAWYQRTHARPPVPASEAIAMIEALYRRGHTDTSIAEATGVSTRTLRRIRTGEVARVYLHTIDALEVLTIHEGIYP